MTFDRRSCFAHASDVLSRPPARPWTERVEPAGQLVVRFLLPLELCQTGNATRHARGWSLARTRESLVRVMSAQLAERRDLQLRVVPARRGLCVELAAPVPGRPLVRAVRFSSHETDAGSNWAKQAIDVLLPPRTRRTRKGLARVVGLNVIEDDRPAKARVVQWCELAPRGAGFVLLEVWTG